MMRRPFELAAAAGSKAHLDAGLVPVMFLPHHHPVVPSLAASVESRYVVVD